MGLLQCAQSTTTLTALSLTHFNTERRGYRVGIDASIWFFHAEYGKEGENPELRTLFFRCAQLINHGFLPLFVFDGPMRPDFKRGKRINKTANKLVTGMRAILDAFGFEHRTAPGEAEAELAWLNRVGIIDGILSDDVDTFLFGARTVLRNHSSTHPSGKSANSVEKCQVLVYNLPHPDAAGLDPEDLIFIAMCSGGDYDEHGIPSCGIKFAHGLALAGFGKSLHQAALRYHHGTSSEARKKEDFEDFLVTWRKDIAHELRTNSSGLLPSKKPSLANNIPATFPDIQILMSYICPVTTASLRHSERYDDLTNDQGWLIKDPSLPRLAETCEFYFEWGFEDIIIKRFRTVIFHGLILRILRRVVLQRNIDSNKSPAEITHYFIQQYFSSPDYKLRSYVDPCLPLVTKIHSTRQHASTSETLEYRLEIDPAFLVRLISSGVKGIRPPDVNEWACDEEGSDDGDAEEGKGKTKRGKKYDPLDPVRIWVPAVLLKEAVPKLVDDFEDVIRKKAEKKAGKGKRTKDSSSSKSQPKETSTTSTKTKVKENLPFVASKTKATGKGKDKPINTFLASFEDRDSDADVEYDADTLLAASRAGTAGSSTVAAKEGKATLWASDGEESVSRRIPQPLSPKVQPRQKASSSTGTQKSVGLSKTSRSGSGSPSKVVAFMDAYFSPSRQRNAADSDDDAEKLFRNPKLQPKPFPMSADEDPFNDDDDDDVPSELPPQTPSPRKRTRTKNKSCGSSSDDSSDLSPSSPGKSNHALTKSPRKSSSHSSPRRLSPKVAAGAQPQVKRTIVDIPHPSRGHSLREPSPTPERRKPYKATTSVAEQNVLSGRSYNVIDISDLSSDSDDEEKRAPILAPKFRPPPKRADPSKNVSSSAGRSSASTTSTSTGNRRPLDVARAKIRSKQSSFKFHEQRCGNLNNPVADPTADPAQELQEPVAQDIDAEDNDDIEEATNEGDGSGSAKKKKKKKKTKKKKIEQSDPPRIPLSKIHPDGVYPEGEIQPYKDDNAWRTTSEEKRYNERMVDQDPEETYQSIRKGAEVHRLVRQHARKHIQPGMSLKEIAENIEEGKKMDFRLVLLFPTGLCGTKGKDFRTANRLASRSQRGSISIIAQLTILPSPWTQLIGHAVLSKGDVLKVDFGVHVKGRILDSAFTMNFEPTYDKLLEAVKAATDTGVREAGIDARLGEIAGAIQETMESYEVEVNGNVYPVRTIENLSGHSIKLYQIHGDKSILMVKNDDPRKMEEGEYFAVETFGSTGRGRVVEGATYRLTTAKSLLNTINQNFGTLAFTQRYLDRAGEKNYILALNHLVSQGIVEEYPPLYDQRGSMTAQFSKKYALISPVGLDRNTPSSCGPL
ncbi:hypothetical protein D9758_004869 [Tetrapyrgos nigripes]|uniref:Methionine aminopeptidase 2 n=1 Tax=Tetrapyrgos nigripes TaxID=182062 RepID=A0A8H5G663_9AGAR|nr:hypothetical protein D9758_004869 [Tetrapyrgos nigripes]